ncbi:formylmethanofuran dehydrogenase subunit A [Desulfococcaceae bacterium HSG7]|nr:formylmethanofuran dehydrogenase subunit A [Desulfococcaceae bacterium HSG7]
MLGITGGTVFDPINGIEGQHKDIWIKNGKIVSPEEVEPGEAQIIDASGLIVMPGGVDIHSHIAGAKANAGRKLCPDDSRKLLRPRTANTRSGSGYITPSTHLTGYLYTEMGYTTVMEAAAAPLMARHTHEELEDIPIIDKGAFLTMGNNHFIMKCIRDGEKEKARDYVSWLLGAAKGFAIKIVNPGGVENWKYGRNVYNLDDEVIGFGVTPRQILTTLARISDQLKLPHPPHIHGLRLGQPGSADITVETMEMMNGLDAHFCHIHFMSYSGERGGFPKSAAAQVAQVINANPNISIDVGQVIFGPATTMTSDGPSQFSLSRRLGGKWMNDDLESESGGGLVPLVYKRNNPLHWTMWLTGLEIFLLTDDPWRVFLTTDHPNAGPFGGYPGVIKLLMDRDFRARECEKMPKKAKKNSILHELNREYTLNEIAIITRAGPAKRLGLKNKGRLGIGADADITIYANQDDKEKMFACPRYVIKDGVIAAKDGQIVCERPGRSLYVAPPYDSQIEKDIRQHFRQAYTISFDNYPILNDHLPFGEMIPCG